MTGSWLLYAFKADRSRSIARQTRQPQLKQRLIAIALLAACWHADAAGAQGPDEVATALATVHEWVGSGANGVGQGARIARLLFPLRIKGQRVLPGGHRW